MHPQVVYRRLTATNTTWLAETVIVLNHGVAVDAKVSCLRVPMLPICGYLCCSGHPLVRRVEEQRFNADV